VIIYPDYINAAKTVAQGRRIPTDKGKGVTAHALLAPFATPPLAALQGATLSPLLPTAHAHAASQSALQSCVAVFIAFFPAIILVATASVKVPHDCTVVCVLCPAAIDWPTLEEMVDACTKGLKLKVDYEVSTGNRQQLLQHFLGQQQHQQ
jgi:hypothetical protein